MGHFYPHSKCCEPPTENMLQEEAKPLFGSLQNRQVSV